MKELTDCARKDDRGFEEAADGEGRESCALRVVGG